VVSVGGANAQLCFSGWRCLSQKICEQKGHMYNVKNSEDSLDFPQTWQLSIVFHPLLMSIYRHSDITFALILCYIS